VPQATRDGIRAYLASKPYIKRHRYFHHLNSSQALSFNLFIPYFESSPAVAEVLLRALGQHASLTGWAPEVVPDLTEGTNIDVVWNTSDGVTTYCEVKLSERDFGKAQHDERHLMKLQKIYGPVLTGHVADALLEPAAFFDAYQILRNVWHLLSAPDRRLIFLMPQENESLSLLLKKTLQGINDATRRRITTLAVEDVLDQLCSDPLSPTLMRTYAEDLRAKYVPAAPPTR
jgi:hypothetical protein